MTFFSCSCCHQVVIWHVTRHVIWMTCHATNIDELHSTAIKATHINPQIKVMKVKLKVKVSVKPRTTIEWDQVPPASLIKQRKPIAMKLFAGLQHRSLFKYGVIWCKLNTSVNDNTSHTNLTNYLWLWRLRLYCTGSKMYVFVIV